MEPTPAERYARAAAGRRHPLTHEFADLYAFGLDDFQIRACREVEDGRGVLVAAPTGSGKTVVGEFAVYAALAQGRKAFYTTPIKALSNQKFRDLVARHGAENVGLLTGDNSLNGEAPIVVMTTEVLRNMLYAGSATLDGLGYVVMDEVHYLADRSRGAVWEEVIIHLAESVSVISLSATVSNAEEFGDWLQTVRGETTIIVEERRPVPLFQHVMVGRQILPLFASEDVDASAGFVREGSPVNPQLVKIARDEWASSRLMRDRRTPRGGAKSAGARRNVGNGRRVWIPGRVEMVERLQRDGLLPAIVFIFSRAGCEAAARQLREAHIRLTSSEEMEEIRAFVSDACQDLPADDLWVLGYYDFVDSLSRGIAAHHAGMLPIFKECVEKLFLRGLVKVVFATETLALGINMPARTVVLEKLDKWNGETHADITPGEYTQLTGRAGRRGLDIEGHAVVLWQPGFDPGRVAGLASTRTYPLRSSFRPSYNMAVNLVHRYGRSKARELLECSFAQFQADRAVVGLARQLRKAEDALSGYAEAAACDRGNFLEYAGLRRSISDAEKRAARNRREERRGLTVDSLRVLRPGDVIHVPAGKWSGWAVVLDPGTNEDPPRPLVLTESRQARRLAIADFTTPVAAVDRLRIPKAFSGRDAAARRELAHRLAAATRSVQRPAQERASKGRDLHADREISRLRDQMKAHPCHSCPDREEHARWGERYAKLDKDARVLRQRVETRTNTVARTFDRVCEVLGELGYLTPADQAPTDQARTDDPSHPGTGTPATAFAPGGAAGSAEPGLPPEPGLLVTEQGRSLMRIYSELDLLVAECLRQDVWADLTPSELAGALSLLVFESRRTEELPPAPPTARLRTTIARMRSDWGRLAETERRHRLDFLKEPDEGFAWAAHAWAEGGDLDDILTVTEMTPGDFVRAMRMLVDRLGQVADASPRNVRTVARSALASCSRGVVAYSSLNEG
ncbi:MAG: DEAD/DEAH box helicase [Nocardioides sp.]